MVQSEQSSLNQLSPKTIDSLVTDIQQLFDKGASLNPSNVSVFGTEVSRKFTESFSRYKEDESAPRLRLSNVGRPFRQLWFQIKSGLKGEPLSSDAKLKFLYGDLLEEFLLLLAMETGHVVTDLQKEVEIDGVTGHIDAIIDGVLVDVKSASTFSFKKFKDRTIVMEDPFGYCAQLAAYSEALGGIDAAFFVVDKTLGHLCLCKFSKEELSHFRVKERIQKVKDVLSKDTPPVEKCYEPIQSGKSGNLALAVGCSYCNHKFNCWRDANNGRGIRTFIYSTGPDYLVHVEREPKVFEAVSNNERKETN
jgi:hypothetical protein